MSKDARFWRNVTLIGLVHVALFIGFVRWSHESTASNTQSVVWMNGGAGDGAASQSQPKATTRPKTAKISMPRPEPESPKKEEREEEQPVLTSAKSEIQLSTPKPTPSATATPKPTPKPTPKATPKPTQKPTPKPSPKKIILAKASPKPSPKAKPTPAESDENEEKVDPDAEKKKLAKAALGKTDIGETDSSQKPPKAIAANSGNGKGTSPGSSGHTGGAGGESQFGWYGSMLHDRFYSEWVQPTTAVPSDAKLAVLVKLRIEKDGRVSNFEVIKPSNNVIVDESVTAVAKRVTQVDPLPAGLVKGEHYDVRINFELNSEQ
jgi:TonB family protein